jgi:hypothetical protein
MCYEKKEKYEKKMGIKGKKNRKKNVVVVQNVPVASSSFHRVLRLWYGARGNPNH